MIVYDSRVEQKFLTIFIKVTRTKRRLIKAGRGFVLADNKDRKEAERLFARFRVSGNSIEQFFDIDLIVCTKRSKDSQVTSNSALFETNVKNISKRPIFVGVEPNYRRSTKPDFELISLKQIKSLPIQMNALTVAKLYGLPVIFNELTELYKQCDVSFLYYKLNDKNQAIQTNDLPGQRVGNFREIKLGVRDGILYWLPPSYPVQQKLYCQKPNCSMWFIKSNDLKRHKETCTDKLIVTAKQVKLIYLDSFFISFLIESA